VHGARYSTECFTRGVLLAFMPLLCLK
jgi:hypothetical protein